MGAGLRLGRWGRSPRSRLADELDALEAVDGPADLQCVPLVAGAEGEELGRSGRSRQRRSRCDRASVESKAGSPSCAGTTSRTVVAGSACVGTRPLAWRLRATRLASRGTVVILRV